MVDLLALREEIDRIDKEMVALYTKRMEIVKGVAEFKISTGKQVFDSMREQQKIETIKELAETEFHKQGVSELFSHIMAISRKLQYQLLHQQGIPKDLEFLAINESDMENPRVVFQGVEGAYSHLAMKTYFGENVENFHVETFRDVMETIAKGDADFGILPIENSTAGSVNDNYDLLMEYDNYIIGEQIIKAAHVLLGTKDASMDMIKTVYSHPQGLMQCKKYLEKHRDWEQVPVINTAVSAKKVATEQDNTQASIASKFAGEYFGLKILAENFCNELNATRFIIVTNKKVYQKEANKISICFEVPHVSGSLYSILSHFIYNNLSMSRIKSRPLEGRNWEYSFFVDFDGNLEDSAVLNALRGVQAEAVNFKILGNY
jgi:Prephenate dehydratase